jgi:hypothetical protein
MNARDELTTLILGKTAPRAADAILAAGYRKPRTITTPEDLDTLPIRSIIALISHSRNVPVVIVFQRGSIEHGGDGWCTPEAIGQIPSEAVFEFIALNGFPTVFTVLHDPEAKP